MVSINTQVKPKIRIIAFDGTRYSGKTTQANMTVNLINTTGEACYFDTSSGDLSNVERYLEQNPNGVAILDNTIARIVAEELVLHGVSDKTAETKYMELLNKYRELFHRFGGVGLLLVMVHDKEIKRRHEIVKSFINKDTKIPDIDNEKLVSYNMENMDQKNLTKNIKFESFVLREDEKILDVSASIWEFLIEKYAFKKPPIGG